MPPEPQDPVEAAKLGNAPTPEGKTPTQARKAAAPSAKPAPKIAPDPDQATPPPPAPVTFRRYRVKKDRTMSHAGHMTLFREGKILSEQHYGADALAGLFRAGLEHEEIDPLIVK